MAIMTLLADLYNFFCISVHVPQKIHSLLDSKEKPNMALDSSSFYHIELQRALREQAFGIRSHALTSSSQAQANASVVLLDASQISVQLDCRGYSIVSNGTAGRTYEAIEDLLKSVSSLYDKRQHELLCSKLSKFSS